MIDDESATCHAERSEAFPPLAGFSTDFLDSSPAFGGVRMTRTVEQYA